MTLKEHRAYRLLNSLLTDIYQRTDRVVFNKTPLGGFYALEDEDEHLLAILDVDDVSVINDMAHEVHCGNRTFSKEIAELKTIIDNAEIIENHI